MVIARLSGGMGNQLFQYAMAKRLALRWNCDLKLDLNTYAGGAEPRAIEFEVFPRKFALDSFRATARRATPEEISRLRNPFFAPSSARRLIRTILTRIAGRAWHPTFVAERQFRFNADMLDLRPPVYLEGYWQSEKYFADIVPIIREEFQLRDPAVVQQARAEVAALRMEKGRVVSVHIRRGDIAYAHEVLQRADVVHSPVTLDYFQQAMAQFEAACCFLVFSDTPKDVAWCRKNLRAPRLAFSEGRSDLQDFALMTACDDQIISNSTFSWWAAWLNTNPGKRVVAPRVWSVSQNPIQMPTDDLLPDTWIKL